MRKFVSPAIFMKKKGPSETRESIMEKRKEDEIKRIEVLLTSEEAGNLTSTEYARLKTKLKRLRGGKNPAFAESFGLSPRLDPKFMPETAKKAQQEEQKRSWIQQWQRQPMKPKSAPQKTGGRGRILSPSKMPPHRKV